MARTRSIRPEFWNHPNVIECGPEARLLLLGLWANCDDGGRHPLTPKAIKGKVFPADAFTAEQIEAWLRELVSNNLADVYGVESMNMTFLEIRDFSYWVKVKRPKFEWPDKSGSVPSKGRRRSVTPQPEPEPAPPPPASSTTTAPKPASKQPRKPRSAPEPVIPTESDLTPYDDHVTAYEHGTWKLEWGNPPGPGCVLPASVQDHMIALHGVKEGLVFE